MNFYENLNLQNKKQILACLMLSTSLVFANNNSINDSNDKSNTAKISNSNEKPDKAVDKKKDDSNKKQKFLNNRQKEAIYRSTKQSFKRSS